MTNKKNLLLERLFQSHVRSISLCLLLCFLVLFFPLSIAIEQSTTTTSPNVQDLRSQKAGWEQIESGVTQDLNSVFFICLNRGTIVGDEGVILRSGDGGNTWVIQDSGVMENLYGVCYYGYTIILVVGTSGTILYTTNSGTNWTTIQTGMMGSYYSCQMVNETVGVAVGVNGIFQPFFTRTNDGWNTWDSTSFYIEHESVFYEGRLSDVCFINTSVGFATAIVDVPTGGAIVRTLDGGASWETVLFYSEPLYSIDFTYEGIGYAVGNNGRILQSTNQGTSWQELESGVSIPLHGVDFPSETSGTIIGDNGLILRTENAGMSWTQQTSGTTANLLAVHCLTDMLGFVAGEQGVILRTRTGGYPEDTTPPETICTLSGTMEGGVYTSDVCVTLNASDDFSGVASTYYTLDEASWLSYNRSFFVTQNGVHTLRFYSIDNAGNTEEEKSIEFTIQHSPTLQISITGGFGLKVHIKNLESTNITNTSWNLTFEGGFLLFGTHKTGTVDIKAGEEVTLNFLLVGFGKPIVTFTINTSQKIVQASVFLFFVRV